MAHAVAEVLLRGRRLHSAANFFSLPYPFMPNGTIKKKMEKGFGFIAQQDGGADLFFHMSATNGQFDSLQEGQSVSFDIEESPKGPRATNVMAA